MLFFGGARPSFRRSILRRGGSGQWLGTSLVFVKSCIFCSKRGIQKSSAPAAGLLSPPAERRLSGLASCKKIQFTFHFHLVKFQLQTMCCDLNAALIKVRPENDTKSVIFRKHNRIPRNMFILYLEVVDSSLGDIPYSLGCQVLTLKTRVRVPVGECRL